MSPSPAPMPGGPLLARSALARRAASVGGRRSLTYLGGSVSFVRCRRSGRHCGVEPAGHGFPARGASVGVAEPRRSVALAAAGPGQTSVVAQPARVSSAVAADALPHDSRSRRLAPPCRCISADAAAHGSVLGVSVGRAAGRVVGRHRSPPDGHASATGAVDRWPCGVGVRGDSFLSLRALGSPFHILIFFLVGIVFRSVRASDRADSPPK